MASRCATPIAQERVPTGRSCSHATGDVIRPCDGRDALLRDPGTRVQEGCNGKKGRGRKKGGGRV